jgi:V-type H+-transporting ATPase subunit H
MSFDPPGYIVSVQNNIRSRPIPWEGAVRAKTFTDESYKKIKAIDKVRKEQRKQVLESEADTYASLFVGGKGGQSIFQAAVKRPEFVSYLLVLLDDSLTGTTAPQA